MNNNDPVLIFRWTVLKEVIESIGKLRAESGGAFGGFGKRMEISHFHFDKDSRTSFVTYSPNYKSLNHLFKTKWNPMGIRLRGFIHSHPGRMSRPSYGDQVYAKRIFNRIEDLDYLWLPIVNTIPETAGFRLTPWVAFFDGNNVAIKKGKIKVTHIPYRSPLLVCGELVVDSIKSNTEMDEIVIGKTKPSFIWANTRGQYTGRSHKNSFMWQNDQKSKTSEGNTDNSPKSIFNTSNTFDRVKDAYDLPLMKKSRIIAIGAGGAAEFLEQMARAGLGQFVIIDPDTVSETNLATQQTYRRDINRPKVDCIAERIRDINPTAKTIALQKSLDDLTDDEIRKLALNPIDGLYAKKTIICGFTDSFFAQARVNRLALNLGLPSLCAQVYKEGRGAEITFTYPGVTPACHRCILSSRYKYFLERGKENDVTSHGTPIFATTRLNAIKGFIALALIHHGSIHPRWGKLLSRIGNRNLVQLRLDPDFADTVGIPVFNRVFEKADPERLFFDEAIWLPQKQESPQTGYLRCPDCGGTGDLRDSTGKFADKRLTPKNSLSKSTTTLNIDTRGVFAIYEQHRRKIL